MHRTFLSIAKEGWPYILGISAIAFALYYFVAWWAALPVVLFLCIVVRVLYEPKRYVPPEPMGLLAPLDGKIFEINQTQDPYLLRDAIQIRLRPSLLGGYYFRAISEGVVCELRDAQTSIRGVSWIRTDEGDDVIVAAPKGLFGLRPFRVRFGQRVGQGRACGLRRLARVVDIYIPASSRVSVKIGHVVRGGESVLAHLVHKHG